MNSNIWKKNALLSYGAVAVMVIIAIITSISLSSGSSSTAQGSDSNKALIDALTVTTVNVDCVNVVNSTGGSTKAVDGKTYIVYDVGAIKSVPPRKWSDAISTPLQGESPPDKLQSAKGSVCQDPFYGVTLANFFANLNVDGVNVGDLNPWLALYKGSPDQINDQAAAFMPLLDVKNASEAQVQKAAQQNLEYQDFAAKLDTLLGRFNVDGIKSLKSTMNLHLTGGGLKVSGLPEVGVNPNQEALPALVLSVTLKGACAPAKVIGLNTGDQRPEVFATPSCQASPSTCKSNCTPNGGCTSNCTPSNCHQHTTGTCPPKKCPCVSPSQGAQPVPTPPSGPSGVPTKAPTPLPTNPTATTPNGGGYNPGSGGAPGGSTSDNGGTQTGNPSPTSPPTCNPSLGCGGAPTGSPTPPS
ncbi:MAG: hypothetical protein ACREGB_01455 [Candidatus Saccharimonadales bacterium]